MPYEILRKSKKGKKCFSVRNKKTKRVFSKCSTRKNAERQLRLLRAIQYDPKFVIDKRKTSYV
jgi:hypothetical protein